MSIEQRDGNETIMTGRVECMLEHNGKVVAATPASVLIETERRSACGHCSVSDRCATSVIAGLFKQRANTLRLDNGLDLQAGDEVVIGIPEHLLLRAALWAYMVPMLFMISFALIVATAGYADLYVFLASIAGLFNGLHLARVLQSRKMSSRIVLLHKTGPATTTVKFDTTRGKE
jgi:sigma-E factor negative regulatory protein RseC